jgi:ribosomal protein L31E
MKKVIEKIKKVFKRKESVYGTRIFDQQSWLDNKVNDAVWKRQFNLD